MMDLVKKDKNLIEEYDVFNKGIHIGTIRSNFQKDKWYIAHINKANLSKSFINFNSKEEASSALIFIKNAIDENPMSEEIRSFFEKELFRLNEDRENALNSFVDLNVKIAKICEICNKHGLQNLTKHLKYDIKEETKKLISFIEENDEKFYEICGKDWTRSLKTYIRNVVRLVDPMGAERI